QRGFRARMLIARDADRPALALRDLNRPQFIGEEITSVGGGGALLAAQRKTILVGAPDVELCGHVLAGLRHGVDSVELLEARIDEAPADRAVVDRGGAAERRIRL